MQGSPDRGELLKQRHNARKTCGVLGADKVDLSEAGGHSHKWGAEGTNTQSQSGSFMICIKGLEECLPAGPATPLLGIAARKTTRERNEDL